MVTHKEWEAPAATETMEMAAAMLAVMAQLQASTRKLLSCGSALSVVVSCSLHLGYIASALMLLVVLVLVRHPPAAAGAAAAAAAAVAVCVWWLS